MPVTETIKQAGTVATGRPARATNLNLPNLLTLIRILLIPVFILLFSAPTPNRALAAAVVFAVAALTDLLDGYLARRRSEVTKLGRLLDPIADKLLVVTGLILLVQFQRVAGLLAILIIAREVAVTGLRAVAASQDVVLSADPIGKYKMTAQVIAIVMLIVEDGVLPESWPLHAGGTILLYVALALGLVSGARYLSTFLQEVSMKNTSRIQ
jgi:CDP-diacylglycerol--glycerol-3-phosphate 3-phosphatidyltransferase